MSLTFPRADIMSFCAFAPGAAPLRLVSRQELSSREASGKTYAKDFGPALWIGSWTTVLLTNEDAIAFEAMLYSLDGAINLFEGRDLRKPYPRFYPDGVFNDTGKINSIGANNKSLSLKSLPASFKLAVGDFLSFDVGTHRALHQVMEAVTANGSGLTTEFEIRPHIWPGTATNTSVILKQPAALFSINPGSISSQMNGGRYTAVSFEGTQAW